MPNPPPNLPFAPEDQTPVPAAMTPTASVVSEVGPLPVVEPIVADLPPVSADPEPVALPPSPVPPPVWPTHVTPHAPTHRLRRWVVTVLATAVVVGGGYAAIRTGLVGLTWFRLSAPSLLSQTAKNLTGLHQIRLETKLSLAVNTTSGNSIPVGDLNTLFGGTATADATIPNLKIQGLGSSLNSYPADTAASLTANLRADLDHAGKQANAELSLSGQASSGGTELKAGAATRRVSGLMYGVIQQFPTFPGEDVTSIIDRWVALPTDTDVMFHSADLVSVDLRQARTSIVNALTTLGQGHEIVIDKTLAHETIDGQSVGHYQVHLDLNAFRTFIAKAPKTTTATNPWLHWAEQQLSDAKKLAGWQKLMDATTIEAWYDQHGKTLRQLHISVRIAPPPDAVALQGKTIVVTVMLHLNQHDANTAITKPDTVLPYDEAVRTVSGVTKEDQLLQHQDDRLTIVANILSALHTVEGKYPASGDELTARIKAVVQSCFGKSTSTPRPAGNVCSAFRPVRYGLVLNDLYTGKPYPYTGDEVSYQVTYTMQIPTENTTFRLRYVDGTNTMTTTARSVEYAATVNPVTTPQTTPSPDSTLDSDGDGLTDYQEITVYHTDPQKKDTDGDGLSDYDEVTIYLTDPLKADTDGDGFTDGGEVAHDYNPLGPGLATPEQLKAWASTPSKTYGPSISNITARPAGKKLRVSWQLDSPGDGQVQFGPTLSYGSVVSDPLIDTKHSLLLIVDPKSQYHFLIQSCTPAPDAKCTTSPDQVVSTE